MSIDNCSRCGGVVEHDTVAGLTICTSCGFVVDEAPALYDVFQGTHVDDDQRPGVWVDHQGRQAQTGENDFRSVMQRGWAEKREAKAASQLRALGASLQLGPSVVNAALDLLLDQLHVLAARCARHYFVADAVAAALYAAARQQQRPLPLVELAGAMGAKPRLLAERLRRLQEQMEWQVEPRNPQQELLRAATALPQLTVNGRQGGRRNPVVAAALGLQEWAGRVLPACDLPDSPYLAAACLALAAQAQRMPVKVPDIMLAFNLHKRRTTVENAMRAICSALWTGACQLPFGTRLRKKEDLGCYMPLVVKQEALMHAAASRGAEAAPQAVAAAGVPAQLVAGKGCVSGGGSGGEGGGRPAEVLRNVATQLGQAVPLAAGVVAALPAGGGQGAQGTASQQASTKAQVHEAGQGVSQDAPHFRHERDAAQNDTMVAEPLGAAAAGAASAEASLGAEAGGGHDEQGPRHKRARTAAELGCSGTDVDTDGLDLIGEDEWRQYIRAPDEVAIFRPQLEAVWHFRPGETAAIGTCKRANITGV